MSTRGLFGFKTKKDTYLCFSPSDSYPAGMGKHWYKIVREYNLKHMEKVLDEIPSIDIINEGTGTNLEKDIASSLNISEEEAKKALEEYDNIYNESDAGIFDSINLGELDFFVNEKDFARDTLFCEWIYYYDYEKKMFVIINNQSGRQHEISLTQNNWQEFFKML